MKQTIVFLDIDGVIFDAQGFFSNFCEKFIQETSLNQETKEKLKDFYGEVKKEKGFFDPQLFLGKISSEYSITKENLDKLWYDEEFFRKFLLVDESFFERIQEKATIGIFSKGEAAFQKKKIEKFNNFINPENVYIFENKIVKINEILVKYKDYKIYMVDDNRNVLESFKQIDGSVFAILINRERTETVNSVDAVLDNISQLTSFLTQRIAS